MVNELLTLERKPVGLPAWPAPGFQVATHAPLVRSAGHLLALPHSGASINRAPRIEPCPLLTVIIYPPTK